MVRSHKKLVERARVAAVSHSVTVAGHSARLAPCRVTINFCEFVFVSRPVRRAGNARTLAKRAARRHRRARRFSSHTIALPQPTRRFQWTNSTTAYPGHIHIVYCPPLSLASTSPWIAPNGNPRLVPIGTLSCNRSYPTGHCKDQ